MGVAYPNFKDWQRESRSSDMMAGFVDTAAVIGPDPYELGISGGANQLAAMPSLHVGWALLIALGTIWISTSNARWLALAHPILTLAVVVLTANHYWADAIAAVVIVVAAWRFTGPSTQAARLIALPANRVAFVPARGTNATQDAA